MVIYDKFFTKNNYITFNILLLRILTIYGAQNEA